MLKSLHIEQLELKNFRCFEHKIINFEKPLVLIEGNNGVGKSSIVEALYYACFMRSLRTHLPRELIRVGADYFFIQVGLHKIIDNSELSHQVSVGFELGKKVVKIDQKNTQSFKELMALYKVITITEDDLLLLQGLPEQRRIFIDQFILLIDPDYGVHLRALRTITANRNVIIKQGRNYGSLYEVLTKQLWEISSVIQKRRIEILASLGHEINKLTSILQVDVFIKLSYVSKKTLLTDFDSFMHAYPTLASQELIMQRSLFGAQLDDIHFNFNESLTRIYASRGQLKLTIILLKLAQLVHLQSLGHSALFVLDDFMTDFDSLYTLKLIELLLNTQRNQLIFTAPTGLSPIISLLKERQCQHIKFTY